MYDGIHVKTWSQLEETTYRQNITYLYTHQVDSFVNVIV